MCYICSHNPFYHGHWKFSNPPPPHTQTHTVRLYHGPVFPLPWQWIDIMVTTTTTPQTTNMWYNDNYYYINCVCVCVEHVTINTSSVSLGGCVNTRYITSWHRSRHNWHYNTITIHDFVCDNNYSLQEVYTYTMGLWEGERAWVLTVFSVLSRTFSVWGVHPFNKTTVYLSA